MPTLSIRRIVMSSSVASESGMSLVESDCRFSTCMLAFEILKDAEGRQIDEAELERLLSAVREKVFQLQGSRFRTAG
jgi:hypothetical protein